MEFDEYQRIATTTAYARGERTEEFELMYYCLGLAGETGEVIEKVKKVVRNDDGVISDEKRHMLTLELGDVLWYLSQIARISGISLAEVANANVRKLASRKERGVIKSEGDIR